jgi:hypothetical protein
MLVVCGRSKLGEGTMVFDIILSSCVTASGGICSSSGNSWLGTTLILSSVQMCEVFKFACAVLCSFGRIQTSCVAMEH